MCANSITVSSDLRPAGRQYVTERLGGPGIRGKVAAAMGKGRTNTSGWQTSAPSNTRAQRSRHQTSKYTTDNSPQTNHIKNITSFFPCNGTISSVCGSCTLVPQPGAVRNLPGLLSGERPSASPVSRPVRSMQRRRDKYCVRAWWRWGMPDQDELDAMTKAWTYAVLDALEAADDKTRLEIVRILCPAGFVIVPADAVESPKQQKN
jgi:hypothetical protein